MMAAIATRHNTRAWRGPAPTARHAFAEQPVLATSYGGLGAGWSTRDRVSVQREVHVTNLAIEFPVPSSIHQKPSLRDRSFLFGSRDDLAGRC